MTCKRLCLIVAALAAAFSFQTQAHPLLCNTREFLAEKLQMRYGETLVGMGLAGNGSVFELMVSDEMSTWTIFYTTPDGISCVVATGEGWLQAKKKPEGEET